MPSTQIGRADAIDGVLPAAIDANCRFMNLQAGSIESRQTIFFRDGADINPKRGRFHQEGDLEHAIIGGEQDALPVVIEGAAAVREDKRHVR